jgi:Cyclic nucleotide-binding domain
MVLTQEFYQALIHIGAILYLVCFLFRNQILLRCFAVAGDIAYTAYYYGVSSQPLWDAMFWSSTNILVNCVMLFILYRENRQSILGDNELKLYRSLNALTPGEFRRLTSLGKWKSATEGTILTVEGQKLDRLYYILEGEVDIEKSGRKIEVKPELFIGEIAFLLQKPATATVKLKTGSLYIEWDHSVLQKAFQKQEGLKHALSALLSTDLATKVARS